MNIRIFRSDKHCAIYARGVSIRVKCPLLLSSLTQNFNHNYTGTKKTTVLTNYCRKDLKAYFRSLFQLKIYYTYKFIMFRKVPYVAANIKNLITS
jgi:translation initiation factor RLI1